MAIRSLTQLGTKVWLDSIDPVELERNRAWGVTGATSNPVIISELIEAGKFDRELIDLIEKGHDDTAVAWELTDRMVKEAQEGFLPVWERTGGDDGYVSFELDPLLEDPATELSVKARARRYVELAKEWSTGEKNRMIKVPATEAGILAMEEIAAMGVTINVTLIFTERQYRAARTAIWRGAGRRATGLEWFKSVYSIFVSRVDVYTAKHVPELGAAAQGQVGIVNAKRIWQENEAFWAPHGLGLKQEMVFASTGVKTKGDPPDKYVAALAGSDIQTNPPATNEYAERRKEPYTRQVDRLPPAEVLAEIDAKVNQGQLEEVLMREGIEKFAGPWKELVELIGRKRGELVHVGK